MPIEARYDAKGKSLRIGGVTWHGRRDSCFVYLSESADAPTDRQLQDALQDATRRRSQSKPLPWHFTIPLRYSGKKVYVYAGFADEDGQLIRGDLALVGRVFCGFYDIQYRVKSAKVIAEGVKHVILQVKTDVNIEKNLLRYTIGGVPYSVPMALCGNVWNDLNGFDMPVDASLSVDMSEDIAAENYRCHE